MNFDFWEEIKRKTVKKSSRDQLMESQKGNCWKCKKSFDTLGVRARVHHQNLNPRDNRISNMVLVCPNCHDKIHQKKSKVRVKDTNPFSFEEYKIVTRKIKPKTKTKSKSKTRRKAIRDELTGEVIGYRTVKVKPKETTTKNKPKTRRKAIRDEWGDIIGYKTVKVKPKETTTKKKTRKKKKKTEDDWW